MTNNRLGTARTRQWIRQLAPDGPACSLFPGCWRTWLPDGNDATTGLACPRLPSKPVAHDSRVSPFCGRAHPCITRWRSASSGSSIAVLEAT